MNLKSIILSERRRHEILHIVWCLNCISFAWNIQKKQRHKNKTWGRGRRQGLTVKVHVGSYWAVKNGFKLILWWCSHNLVNLLKIIKLYLEKCEVYDMQNKPQNFLETKTTLLSSYCSYSCFIDEAIDFLSLPEE